MSEGGFVELEDRMPAEARAERWQGTWPGGSRLALWVVPNVEHYGYVPRSGQARPVWPRMSPPDVQQYGLRDFGNRVGLWRTFEVLDAERVRVTASTNLSVLVRYPEVRDAIVERDWEVMSHGIENTELIYDYAEEEERRFLEEARELARELVGQELVGMLGPAISGTYRTPDLLAEAGYLYHADWVHDDTVTFVRVRSGRLLSLPYNYELNDSLFLTRGRDVDDWVAAWKVHFDELFRRSQDGPVVCAFPFHPYLVGQPHIVDAFAEIVRYMARTTGVWSATGAEIVRWVLGAPDPGLDGAHGESGQRERVVARSGARAREGGVVPAVVGIPAAEGMDHEWYRYSALPERGALRWPGGARLAVVPVVDLGGLEERVDQIRRTTGDVSGGIAQGPRSYHPNLTRWSQRLYGYRVGAWRLLEVLGDLGWRPCVAVDAWCAEHAPGVVDAYVHDLGAEVVAHGRASTDVIDSTMSVDEEGAYLDSSLAALGRWQGHFRGGWFSPEYAESERTPGLLRARGVKYVLDWPNDEQPYPMAGRAQGMWVLPSFLELDDQWVFVTQGLSGRHWSERLERVVDRLWREGARSGRVLVIVLRPWLSGQPARLGAVRAGLGRVGALWGVWHAQGSEVVEWSEKALARASGADGAPWRWEEGR